ncbi:PREDICTED: uncharacterized protein LOC109165687 [Ipomoea nil]|uniref:uncharacterized protein LOC109165687 n=1 Tax=Ipomoea nil TaxID=35883 RepID=UPI0009014B18|nr:PREDICTED: uncharacterized protein LOC109165687 [Ipomoea nil]
MAKSMRSKREKRLRAIRREIVSADPITQKKEDAKLAAQEAALAAPKVPVRSQSTTNRTTAMSIEPAPTTSIDKDNNMDVEMDDDTQGMKSLKPIGKKMKKKMKLAKKKGYGKGKLKKRHV